MMKIYLVGGAVRDKLLQKYFNYTTNQQHIDNDWVVTGASPEEMLALGYTPVGKDFPVFLHPETREEYALARTERKTGKGYAGFTFHTSSEVSLEEDLKRRDLTINAIAMTEEETLIDPYHGEYDLSHRILRHVSEAFCEDPVRILRLARFMARFSPLSFTIAPETLSLMKKMTASGEVNALVPDRVWQETQKALCEPSAEIFFKVLQSCGALEILYRELHHLCFSKIALDFQDSLLNFAKISLFLEKGSILSLCQRYPIPTAYKELGLLANKTQTYFNQTTFSTPDILELLEKGDAFRKKKQFVHLLTLFEQKESSSIFKKALELTASVSTGSLIQEGYNGKQLGEKIKQIRLERLIAYFGEST